MTHSKIVRILKYAIQVLEESEPQLIEPKEDEVVEKARWLVENSRAQATKDFASGIVSFYDFNGYLSERQKTLIENTYKQQRKEP